MQAERGLKWRRAALQHAEQIVGVGRAIDDGMQRAAENRPRGRGMEVAQRSGARVIAGTRAAPAPSRGVAAFGVASCRARAH